GWHEYNCDRDHDVAGTSTSSLSLHDALPIFPKEETIAESENVLIGQPSAAFLPAATRAIMRQFIEQQGIRDVKIALMSRKYGDEVLQELVTNLTPHKTGENLYEALQTHLNWFLPAHYSMVAMDEEGSLKDHFEPL